MNQGQSSPRASKPFRTSPSLIIQPIAPDENRAVPLVTVASLTTSIEPLMRVLDGAKHTRRRKRHSVGCARVSALGG